MFDKILKAHEAIRPEVAVTPLERSALLSAQLGCEVLLKCDHMQPTGSFKLRGATNRILKLSAAEKRRGIVTSSSGNHGQATARAAALAGVNVTVYVSVTTSRLKMDAIKALGAELVVLQGSVLEAELTARRVAEDDGRVYVSPYNDVDVIAGQGTLGLELLQQEPELDAVFASVGCGGLIGGLGLAIKHLRPETAVIGVWPENAPAMLRSLQAGEIVDVEDVPTLSDGTAGAVEPGSLTFPICQQVIDDYITVTEEQIAGAMRRLAEAERWMVEGAAGVALAGLVKSKERFKGKKVAVVLCGRNIGIDTYLNAIQGARIPA